MSQQKRQREEEERREVDYVVMVGKMAGGLTLPWLVSLEATPLL